MTSDWPPLSYSPTGVPEIAPDWLAANAGAVQILDVREPTEFDGPLGHIPGAVLIPLGQLPDRVAELYPATPVVAVCRSGARSAQATLFLQSAGFEKAANLPGGMLRWRAEGRAVAVGRP
jgi:sulfur dioxygenase